MDDRTHPVRLIFFNLPQMKDKNWSVSMVVDVVVGDGDGDDDGDGAVVSSVVDEDVILIVVGV